MILLLGSCAQKEEQKALQTVTDVYISPWQEPYGLQVDDSLQFMAFVQPEDVRSEEVVWSVLQGDGIVKVDETTGWVVAQKEGWTSLVAEHVPSGIQDTTFIVVGEEISEVETIKFSKRLYDVVEGRSIQVIANTNPFDVNDLGLIRYGVEDEDIANIDGSGLVSAHSPGLTVLTSYTNNFLKEQIVSEAVLKVHELIPITAINDLPQEVIIDRGADLKLDFTYLPENANDTIFDYYTSDSTIVIIENQTLKAVGEGKAFVFISNGKITGGPVTVNVIAPVPAESMTINIPEETVLPSFGETLTLTTTFIPENTTNKNVTWSSSDETILSVNEKGVVMAISEGEAIIKAVAEDGGLTDEITIKVETTIQYYVEGNDENNLADFAGAYQLDLTTVIDDSRLGEDEEVMHLIRNDNPYPNLTFDLDQPLDLQKNGIFKLWLKTTDPGKEVQNNIISLVIRDALGTGATQLKLDQDIVTDRYGEWVEYTFDFSQLTAKTEYQKVVIFFAINSDDGTAVGMEYYFNDIRGPYLQ